MTTIRNYTDTCTISKVTDFVTKQTKVWYIALAEPGASIMISWLVPKQMQDDVMEELTHAMYHKRTLEQVAQRLALQGYTVDPKDTNPHGEAVLARAGLPLQCTS